MNRITPLLVACTVAACSRTPLPGSQGATSSDPGSGGGGDGGAGGATTTSSSSGAGGADRPCEAPPCVAPWARGFASDAGYFTGVAADLCGDLVAAGVVGGPVDFGDGELVGDKRGFVLALDPDGNYLWAEDLGEDNRVQALAIDTSRNLFVAGRFSDGLAIGGLTVSADGAALFVGKLDPSGAALWLHAYEHGIDVLALAADGAGGVVVTGRAPGEPIDFGGGPLPEGFKAFVVALDAAGNHRFSHVFGEGWTWPNALAVDGAGNAFIGGWFTQTLSLAGGPLLETTGLSLLDQDAFLGKLDASGSHLWSKRFGDESQQQLLASSVDAAGRVATTGVFSGTIDFGGDALDSGGVAETKGFVALLDPDGEHVASFVPDALPSPSAILLRDGLVVAGLSPSGFSAAITRFDEAGIPLETSSLDNSAGPPVVGTIPGGIVFAGSVTQPTDLGTGEVLDPGYYVARACDPVP